MNEVERYETDLLSIIKEGKNLTEGYVEVRPSIRIKAGREREFARLCDNYYELKFNQIVENDTDTITPVYDSLVKLVEAETKDYYMSKAEDFSLETKDEVERFKNLVKSYNTVDNAYELTVKNLNDLYLKRENTQEWQQRVDELNSEVKRLTENSTSLVEQINVARRNVNNTLIKYAEEQMQAIRDNFVRTSKDAAKEAAMDHNIILASDVNEYNSLYRLVLVLRNANTIEDFSQLECLNDLMFVTSDQRPFLNNEVLPNIKFLTYARKDGNYLTTNNELIARVRKEMENLEINNKGNIRTKNGIFLTKEAQVEYDIYLDMLNILHRANDNTANLENVWGQAYVLETDKPEFIDLLNKSRFFRTYNPDIKRKEQNEKLIQELYAYLDELARTVTSYTGVANLPIKSTNMVGDRAWVVTESDYEEANRIIEIINLLLNQNENLEPVWDIANIKKEDMSRFRSLANATRKLGGYAPRIPVNDAEIENVKEVVKDLFKRARDTENALLAANGKVLESDNELYKLLQDKYSYLEAAKASENLVPVDGVLIDSRYSDKYHEVNNKIENLLNNQNVVKEPEVIEVNESETISLDSSASEEIDFSANDQQIEELKKNLKELESGSNFGELGKEFLRVSNELIDLLEKAKSSKNVEVLGDCYFANEEDKNKAIELQSSYNAYVEALNKMRHVAKNVAINSDISEAPVIENVQTEGGIPVPTSEDLPPINGSGIIEEGNTIDFSANDNELADLKARLAELSAKSSHNELERTEFDLLSEQIEILENAKKSENSIEVGGLRFASNEDKEKYAESLAKLNKINADLGLPQHGNGAPSEESHNEEAYISNDEKIAELKEEMVKLEPRLDSDELAQQIYALLGKQIEVLENGKNSENTIEMQDLKFASEEDKDAYLLAQANLDEILESLKNSNDGKKKGKLRKKIVAIRDWFGNKLGNTKVGGFVNRHKEMLRLIAVIGIGLTAAIYILPQLVPALIFANSCSAAAIPALSGFFNSISSAIAPLAGMTFTPGVGAINLGVEASMAGPMLLSALSKIGVVGLGTALTFKGIKTYNTRDKESYLSDAQRRNIIQKIADLVYELKKQWQKLMVNVHLKEEALNNKIDNLFKKQKEVQEQIEQSETVVVEEQQPIGTIEGERRQLTKEEREEIGRKIQEKSRQAREQVQLAQAQKLAEEESMNLEDALKIIKERAESSTRHSTHKELPRPIEINDDDIPTLEEAEAARDLNESEAAEEERKRLAGASRPVPVVEVPSADAIINQLGGGVSESYPAAGADGIMSQEEIEALLAGTPVVEAVPEPEPQVVQEPSEEEAIAKEIASREEQIRQAQNALDKAASDNMKLTWQNVINKLNAEIEELKARGR